MRTAQLELDLPPPARLPEAGDCARCGCPKACHWHGFGRCIDCHCREYSGRAVEIISLDTFDPRRLARRADPVSSCAAARRAVATDLVRGHDARILLALRDARQTHRDPLLWRLTAKQIGARTDLTNVQVCRRLGPNGRLRTEHLVRLVPAIRGEQLFEAVL